MPKFGGLIKLIVFIHSNPLRRNLRTGGKRKFSACGLIANC
jgi:hypothetical protein